MSDEIKSALASESAHYYDQQGNPVYEVPYADPSKGMRPTTLADARKLFLAPSVTKICSVAAKPGVEVYKATQIIQASLTLPMQQGEILDAYALRVIEDAKQHSIAAMGRGKECHTAIEDFIGGQQSLLWQSHCENLQGALQQYGIDIFQGKSEHSFYHESGFGGKVDWHTDEIVIDFKTKDKLTETVKGKVKDKKLAWPENCEQLAAYSKGLGHSFSNRIINVFIGVEDCEIRIIEWSKEDYEKGFKAFCCLLEFWKLRNDYDPTKDKI